MNAVKRCLALIAATLVVGACGGDPIPGAGTDLSIRATPGAIWVRDNTSASVIIEAVDKLGGPVQGTWTVDTLTITGPFTVVRDTLYQLTSTGPLGVSAKFVVTPTAEGEGTVVFSGTGGSITVPVRIAPDTTAFHVVANDTTPTLFQPITVTAPTGIVFTGGSVVRFYTGPLPIDSANGGIAFSVTTGFSADSSQMTFVMGPGAHGFMKISGIASRSTPGLTSSAKSDFALGAVATVDTNAFTVTPKFRFSALATPRVTNSVFDTLVLTAPANYRFLSATKVEFFRLVGANITATNPTGYTVVNGQSNPKIVSLSANSDTLKLLVAVGARGRLKISAVAFDTAPALKFFVRAPAAETFDLRSSIDTSNFAITFSKPSPIAEGDTVTATAPAGMRFMKTTVSIHATSSGTFSGGDSARIVLYSPDSTKITFKLPPGASGKAHFRMGLKADPEITWNGRSAGTISAVAAPAVVATMTPSTANGNDTVVVVLDGTGPNRFRPVSQAILNGTPGIKMSISTDSLTLKVLPPPGQTGPLTLTGIRYTALPAFQVQANTATSLTVNTAADLGQDDPEVAAVPQINVPAAGGVKGIWDLATYSAPDRTDDGGIIGAQYYTIHNTTARSVTISVDWSPFGPPTASGSQLDPDVDIMLVSAVGAYGTQIGTAFQGATGVKPQAITAALAANTNYLLVVIYYDSGATVTDPTTFGITIR